MRKFIPALALALLAAPALAKPPELQGAIAAPAPYGCSDFGFLFIDWYHAELWSDTNPPKGAQYALTLNYKTDFTGEDLTGASVDEMARMSGRPESDFAAARAQMAAAFPSVLPGDRITALRRPDGTVDFYANGAPTGRLTVDGDLFMDIWLGPQSRGSSARDKMLRGVCAR